MAVETLATNAYSVGNGATVAFSLPFYFIDPAHIVITLNGVVQVGGFVITGTRVPAGGTVTFTTAPPATVIVGRKRVVPITQPVDTQNNQTIFEDVFDDSLDRRCMVEQQIQTQLSRAIQLPEGDTANPVLPTSVGNGGKVVTLNSGETGFTYNDPMVDRAEDAAASAEASAILAASGAGAWSTAAIAIYATPPVSPAANDSYLVSPWGGTGAWAGKQNQKATWNGTAWVFTGLPVNNQTLVVGPVLYKYAYHSDAGGYLWRALVARRLKWAPNQSLVTEGDSIAAGNGAVPGVNAFPDVIAARNGMAVQNNAVGGKTTYQALISAYATPNAYYKGSWPNGNRNAYLYEGGHNDGLYAALSPALASTIAGNDLTWWTKICAKTAVPVSALTLSGFGSSIAGVLCMASSQLSGNGKFSATPGHTISGTVTGDNIVVWTYAGDAAVARMSAFTLTIDGAVVLTYNGDGLYTNPSNDSNTGGLCPRAVVYRGMGAGNHSFVITVLAGPGVVYVDSVGTLLEPTRAPDVCFMLAPRPLNYNIPPGGGSSPAVFELMDAARQAWIADYSEYPIACARPNDWLKPTDYNIDQEHPNVAGHLDCANSVFDVQLNLGDYDDSNVVTFSVNGFSPSGAYTTSGQFTRIGKRVFFSYVIQMSPGTTFTSVLGTSNVSLPANLPFFSFAEAAAVMNETDQVLIGMSQMKSDSNGGGVYPPAFSLTGKKIGISGSYNTG